MKHSLYWISKTIKSVFLSTWRTALDWFPLLVLSNIPTFKYWNAKSWVLRSPVSIYTDSEVISSCCSTLTNVYILSIPKFSRRSKPLPWNSEMYLIWAKIVISNLFFSYTSSLFQNLLHLLSSSTLKRKICNFYTSVRNKRSHKEKPNTEETIEYKWVEKIIFSWT